MTLLIPTWSNCIYLGISTPIQYVLWIFNLVGGAAGVSGGNLFFFLQQHYEKKREDPFSLPSSIFCFKVGWKVSGHVNSRGPSKPQGCLLKFATPAGLQKGPPRISRWNTNTDSSVYIFLYEAIKVCMMIQPLPGWLGEQDRLYKWNEAKINK